MHARRAVDSLDRYCRRTWDLLFVDTQSC